MIPCSHHHVTLQPHLSLSVTKESSTTTNSTRLARIPKILQQPPLQLRRSYCPSSLLTPPPPVLRRRSRMSSTPAASELKGGGNEEVAEEVCSPQGFAEVVVVRHGETEWNASRIMQGHLDPELNEVGRQQAIAVARHLSKEPNFAAIYSSDLKRAVETAQTIANICGLPEVQLDPALRERNLGDLQGLTLRDSAKLQPEGYKIVQSSKRDKELPGGGESLNQLSDRSVSALQKIARKHKGERVIVVSHGGTIRELHRHALPTKPFNGRIHNTSVNVLHISGLKDRWIVKKWGDASHLREIGVLENAFGGDSSSG